MALASYIFNIFGNFLLDLTELSFLYRDNVGIYTKEHERTHTCSYHDGRIYNLMLGYCSHDVVTMDKMATHDKYTFFGILFARLMGTNLPTPISP